MKQEASPIVRSSLLILIQYNYLDLLTEIYHRPNHAVNTFYYRSSSGLSDNRDVFHLLSLLLLSFYRSGFFVP